MPHEPKARAEGRTADPKSAILAAAKWKSSGLSYEHARSLAFLPLEPDDTAALLGDVRYRVEAVKIPYFDLSGKQTSFFRVRFLSKLPGFAGMVDKPQRYAQPKATINEVYLPPILDVPWSAVANDTSVTIHVTEGEFKAACACANGLVTLGLGGVDVWRATKRGIDFLPVLSEIRWAGRQVVIVYDSDAATNPNVVRAQRKLATELLNRGAKPSIASLPPAKDGGKQGLDDFIVARGAEALSEILSDAPPFGEAASLWELNEEVVYVKDPGICIVRDTGQKINPTAFLAHAFANRHYMTVEQTKQGIPLLKKKKLAPRWMEWEHRHELAGMTYAPGKPQIHDNRWNSWQGWGCAPVKGDISIWDELLSFLFASEPASRKWFEQWCAYPLQHPGAKLYSAPLLWGTEKGTGKTFVAYALMKIYGKNSVEIKNKDLRGGFNGWQANRQFIYGDEIASADAGVKRIDSEWMKSLITQDTVKINEKYMPEIVIPDVMNFMFTSNHPDALFLEDGDRRYFVHEVVGRPLHRTFYDKADLWLKGTGPSHLFAHLLELDLTGFNPHAEAPFTKAKDNMLRDCKSDLGAWCGMLREDPETALAPLGPEIAKRAALLTAQQLVWAYDPEHSTKVTANGMGREMKRAGFRQTEVIRTTKGLVRLYIVREVEKWGRASGVVRRQHFDGLFGNSKI